jgi:hypothetical protein
MKEVATVKERPGETKKGLWFSSGSMALACFLCVASSLIFVSASTGGIYTYTELQPPGWDYVLPSSINNSGVMVGTGLKGGTRKGFIYDGLTCTELQATGWDSLWPSAINDNGVVVGYGSQTGTLKGFIYDGLTCTELQATGWDFLQPSSINNSEVVVGYGPKGGVWTGFICEGGTCTELLAPGWDFLLATSINDNGVVVGIGSQNCTQKGFVLDGTGCTPLLPDGWSSAYTTSINDRGIVVGAGAPPAPGPIMMGFIAFPPTLEGRIAEIAQILDFFDACVAAGTLTGSSPGASGQAQLKNLGKLFTSSAQSIAAGNDKKACQDLAKACSRTDTYVNSSDAVAEAAGAELQELILALMNNLGCQ